MLNDNRLILHISSAPANISIWIKLNLSDCRTWCEVWPCWVVYGTVSRVWMMLPVELTGTRIPGSNLFLTPLLSLNAKRKSTKMLPVSTYLPQNPFTGEALQKCSVALKNHFCFCPSSVNEPSAASSGMGKGLPLVLARGEDSLESFITISPRGVVGRDDSWCAGFSPSPIQTGSEFEASVPVVLAFAWADTWNPWCYLHLQIFPYPLQ